MALVREDGYIESQLGGVVACRVEVPVSTSLLGCNQVELVLDHGKAGKTITWVPWYVALDLARTIFGLHENVLNHRKEWPAATIEDERNPPGTHGVTSVPSLNLSDDETSRSSP